MLLSISSRAPSATGLGYLLHKNPANLYTAELPFGKAFVFYPAASDQHCTACLLLELDPAGLDHISDRPYVASSYLTVALRQVFGTALSGVCHKRPELVTQKLPLELIVEVVRSRAGVAVFHQLFEPLGYTVSAAPIDNHYFRLSLQASVTVHDALSHLYVLLPVLDEEKHYYISQDEIDKLIRHGAGWLPQHPARELIVKRYLKKSPSLVEQALDQLLIEDKPAAPSRNDEQDLERPMTLHTQRLNLVATRLKELGAKSILDLGCGEGKLLRRLLADRFFERLVGVDVSHRSLETAAARLRPSPRLTLLQGSLLYRDNRLNNFDAAALVEVIEHLEPSRLPLLERVLFEFARPRQVILTTPNREYNQLFPTLAPGNFRHADHRFEWTRAEFAAWASSVAARFGYQVQFQPVGAIDATHGPPSQMAIFSL